MNLLATQIARWRSDPLRFIEEVMVLDSGQPLGRAMTPWQREMLAGVLAHPYSYLEVPRGSGKTTLAAALALSWLILGRHGGRYYVAAADADQGGILHDQLAGFVSRSPLLSRAVRIERWRALVPATDARIEVLAADAGSNLGLIPDGVIADELAVWPSEDLWFSLWTAAGKRPGCRVLVLSTPGVVGHFAQRVRDLASEGGRWYYYHRGKPAEFTPADYIEEMRRTLPPEVFGRFFEARWTQGGGRPITPEDVGSVFDPQLPRQPRGTRGVAYVAALDVGLVSDRSVLVVLHQEESGVVVIDRLEVWEGSHDNRVLFADLAEALRRIHRDFNHPTIIVDPWQSLNLVETLRAEGLKFDEAKFTSEYRHRIDANLFRLIKDRQLRCFAGTPEADLLADEMLNLEVELKPGGWRFNHRPGLHDDAWTAVAMAAAAVVANPPTADDPEAVEALRRMKIYVGSPSYGDWAAESDAALFAALRGRRQYLDEATDLQERMNRSGVKRHEGGIYTT